MPYILEPDEKIFSLSLGAGNSGREFDLATNYRIAEFKIAEFKFIQWQQEGRNTIRQNNTFIDFFNLAEYQTDRKRFLYVTGAEKPLQFFKNHRDLNSVLSKNISVRNKFRDKYKDKYKVVSEYYNDVKDLVEIVDLKVIVPAFREFEALQEEA